MMMAILMLMAVIMMMMMINENSNSHNSPFKGKVHDYRLPSNPGVISYIIHLHVGSVMWTLPPARLHQRVYSFCTAWVRKWVCTFCLIWSRIGMDFQRTTGKSTHIYRFN